MAYTVTGLNNGQVCYFQVRAVNPSGDGVASDEVSATPAAVPVAVVTAVGRHESVSLTWPKSSDATIQKWQYRQGTVSGAYDGWTDMGSSDHETAAYTVTGLSNGQAYYFQVRAVNPSGDGVASNEVSATPAPVPAKPDNFGAAPRHQSVELTWDDPNDSTIGKWEYRSKPASGSYGGWTQISTDASTVSYTVSNSHYGC